MYYTYRINDLSQLTLRKLEQSLVLRKICSHFYLPNILEYPLKNYPRSLQHCCLSLPNLHTLPLTVF